MYKLIISKKPFYEFRIRFYNNLSLNKKSLVTSFIIRIGKIEFYFLNKNCKDYTELLEDSEDNASFADN
jgi:hypothetical protein